jgi:putative restriction endonuclease
MFFGTSSESWNGQSSKRHGGATEDYTRGLEYAWDTRAELMDILECTLIEKAACENGWEHVLESNDTVVVLASARHRAQARVESAPAGDGWLLEVSGELLQQELARSCAGVIEHPGVFSTRNIEGLASLLRRAAALAQSLPNQAALTYKLAVVKELQEIGDIGTEIERLVKQRVGQDTFRQALMDYWGGACAVTGIGIPEMLRASHLKPWAKCGCDEERLDVFNGFLLTANLDALFDRGLITFSDTGLLICSSRISTQDGKNIGLKDGLILRWLAPEHQPYLAWHREYVFDAEGQ